MNITFLIGNGFDLKMGMKTRYKDMYESYINVESEDETIAEFKKELQKDAPNEYTNWSDFEEAMGRYASKVKSESEFIKCVRNFKNHMVTYLKYEEKAFIDYLAGFSNRDNICGYAALNFIANFHKGQTPNVIREIEGLWKNRFVCIIVFPLITQVL